MQRSGLEATNPRAAKFVCAHILRTTDFLSRVWAVTPSSGYFPLQEWMVCAGYIWVVDTTSFPFSFPPWWWLGIWGRANPHTHTSSECLIHAENSSRRAQWGRAPGLLSLPSFPIYLLWPEAAANNSTHGSQYSLLQTWPHLASGAYSKEREVLCPFLPLYTVWSFYHQVYTEHKYNSIWDESI